MPELFPRAPHPKLFNGGYHKWVGHHPSKPERVLKVFDGFDQANMTEEYRALYVKAEFCLTKIMCFLIPEHTTDVHFAGLVKTRARPLDQSSTQNIGATINDYVDDQGSMRWPADWKDQMKRFTEEANRAGVEFDPDDEEFVHDRKNNTLKYVDSFSPWRRPVFLDERREIIPCFQKDRLRMSILETLHGKTQEVALRYLARLEGLFDRARKLKEKLPGEAKSSKR